MLSKIYEDKILLLQQYKGVIYILAENDKKKIVLLTNKNDKFSQIGILDLEYDQVNDVAINFIHNLLGIITTHPKIYIYKISSTLYKMNVNRNIIKCEKIKFNESGKYLCCYNSSKINNIWCLTNNDWIKCKIKQDSLEYLYHLHFKICLKKGKN